MKHNIFANLVGTSTVSTDSRPAASSNNDVRTDDSSSSLTVDRAASDDTMRVLVYNWRDIEHPEAGGAEVFTHETLKRIVERGHEATLVTAAFDGCEREKYIDGVQIVRDGGQVTVYPQAKKQYRRFQGDVDVVVDEINGLPFMTPMYVNEPVVALIHHVVGKVWFYEMPFPLDRLGYDLEKWCLKLYQNVPTVTVSTSTRRDLADLGFDDVTVVPEGLDFEPLEDVPDKYGRPTFLFIGRMKRAKRPHHVLRAFEYIQTQYPEAELHMVGDGYMLDELRVNTSGGITFHGYVPEEKKRELMKRSHVLLVPSVREGWGLVVTEANAMGTPAVGYDVKGLRDSIRNGENGLLCAQDPMRLAQRAVTILETQYEKYADTALELSSGHNWDLTADVFERTLAEVTE